MADILKLAKELATKGPVKVEDCPKRIRILLNKIYIVDAITAKYVWEHRYYPQYYIPRSAVEHLKLMQRDIYSEGFHLCRYAVNGCEISSVVVFQSGPLEDLVRFDFKSMDAWFEEDEQIYVHPKDPYKRIDIRRSSREIRVEIDGVVVAKTTNAALLFETMLRTRYYLPPTCVDQTLLTPSDTVTSCPYKGEAAYYNITVKGREITDALWWYRYPTTESTAISGMWCFYNEKVDIFVDGIKEIK